ncbi:MAG: FecR domain-containing protein [Spirochaetaceae bacterium]|nr:FecR domain-containing protein [Spirochaetaceae bacterium]
MKKNIIFILIFTIFASTLYAQSIARVAFVDGWVDVRTAAGVVDEALIGDDLSAGSSIITGRDGYAELLERPSGSTFRVSPNTVFAIREREVNGRNESVLAVAVGEVAFKVNRVAGSGTLVATNSTVAGVRGTEFVVFSGSDGTTLIAVAEGLVEVEAYGRSVELYADEAVEVRPGSPPGPKIQLLGRALDFSQWNESRRQEFLNDPVAALRAVDRRLDYYNEKIQELQPQFLEMTERVLQMWAELDRIYLEQGQDAATQYDRTVLGPASINAVHIGLNVRYYALSALSMRRFVVGNMYAEMKSRYITRLNDPVFIEFRNLYNEVLRKFEEITISRINATDI